MAISSVKASTSERFNLSGLLENILVKFGNNRV